MTGTEPTMGEVVRRLEEVSGQLQRTSEDIRTDRTEQARTYVRQDVYNSDKRSEELARESIAKDTVELEARLDKADAFKRQIMAGVSVGAILLVINVVIALSALLATKGG
jgi:hypothetical protein